MAAEQRREVKERKSEIERKRRGGGLKVVTEKGRLVGNINAPPPLTRTINVSLIKALEPQLVSQPAGEKGGCAAQLLHKNGCSCMNVLQPDKDVQAQHNTPPI